jgi:hypothetical protein
MFSGDYYSYKGGIRIEVPIANAGAEAQYTQSRVQQQQAQSSYRQEMSNVALEVGFALSRLHEHAGLIEFRHGRRSHSFWSPPCGCRPPASHPDWARSSLR